MSFFYSRKNPKNQNFEKVKNASGDIIILHMRTKNRNHMMYGSWDTKWDRQNFLSFGLFFSLSSPPPTPKWSRKLKSWKKWKKCLEILSFYTYMCTVNEDHMIYGFWNIMCDRQKFLSFWAIFLPFQPLDKLENQNFNIEKKYLEILSFYTFEP